MSSPRLEDLLERERIANRAKHWVRLVTACNSRCLFCLDADTPRNVFLSVEEIQADLDRGLDELGADKVILSGGEASLHPKFLDMVRYAKERGYDRVQTVTNGYRYAEKAFYEASIAAGLGEITFSLHGHTAALHDELTQTKGAFKRICKGILRAVRDPRVICNVDIVINGMNVANIDEIVEFAIQLGVTEFDLLHVIPQANAYDNRDRMFYDVREHLPKLHKVFRLNHHPGFVVWTNRFPVSFLEGLEDLIQDPHKMLDEVNGRRFQVRRYLDTGVPLDCRQPERCVHCFIEPFCTTMDRVVRRQREAGWRVWWIGDGDDTRVPPAGIERIGLHLADVEELAAWRSDPRIGLDGRPLGLYAQVDEAGPVPAGDEPLTLVATAAAHLEAWLDEEIDLVVHLNQETAAWMLAHRERVERALDRIQLHQPGRDNLAAAAAADVRDPAAFFAALGLRVRTSGLPACAAPGAELVASPKVLPAKLFEEETGRLSVRKLAEYHIHQGYSAKSVRCADCPVVERCEGLPIHMVRDQGLRLARPLEGAWAADASEQLERRWPTPPPRLSKGRPPEAVAASLPGHSLPTTAKRDPLAILAEKQEARRRRKQGLPPLQPPEG